MVSSPVRVVGPNALKTLVAYGGTVVDLRRPDGDGHRDLPERLAGSGADPSELVLLLASDVSAGLRTATELQGRGYACVVVVNAGEAPDAGAPAGMPD